MQQGDVEKTKANVDDLINDYDYAPSTTVKEGIKRFVSWYQNIMNNRLKVVILHIITTKTF